MISTVIGKRAEFGFAEAPFPFLCLLTPSVASGLVAQQAHCEARHARAGCGPRIDRPLLT